MTLRRRGRFGVGAVLPMVLVAGFAVASLTSLAGGEASADDHQLELVSIEAGNGKTQSCAGTVTAEVAPAGTVTVIDVSLQLE